MSVLNRIRLLFFFALISLVSCAEEELQSSQVQENIDYLQIVAFDCDNPQQEDISQVADALLKLMNEYQAAGAEGECVAFFSEIDQQPTRIIRDYLWRDFNSIYAYALYRADKNELAQARMDLALSIEYDNPTDQQLFRDYSYAAAIVYGDPQRQEDAINYCKLAMEAAERASLTSGVQWTSSILGRLYQKNGMMAEALELYHKSLSNARALGDVTGLANAYNVMSDIFVFWRLADEAEQYSDSALMTVDEVRLNASSVAGDTHRIRAKIKELKGESDSALYYLNKAMIIYEILPYNSGQDEADLALGRLLLDKNSPESIESGVKVLERVINNATRVEPRAAAYAHLARNYYAQSDEENCAKMMNSLFELMQQNSISITYLDEDVCRFAFEYFIERQNISAAELFSDLYIRQIERRSLDNVSRALAIASQEHLNIQHEKEMRKATYRTIIIICSIVVFVAIALTSILVIHRRKRMKLTAELKQGMIKNAYKMEFAQNLWGEGYQDASNNFLIPQLFRKNGESAFREKFESLYPQFLPLLRKNVENISRNDELLCMMIALDQDLNQIAYNMGIEKTSVNQARYRLRKKMGLNKEESLKKKILEITNTKYS